MASVTCSNIVKEYTARARTVRAVSDLNLHVEEGEMLVVVGPSGCGKTTTLRLVAGLEQPDSGDILIDDRVVNDVPPHHRDIAMVFQDYALYPHMTVFKNMAFPLRMRGVARSQTKRRVHEIAEPLGLLPLMKQRPGTLSGGERQRVAVGRAIVRDPKVFLFDEPLAALDAELRRHMRTEMKSLHQRVRTTMIFVTHDQEEAMTLADRVVVMKGGVVQQEGAPLAIYDRPCNRFVAGFIGSPSMNFLEGRIECADGRALFVTGEGHELNLSGATRPADDAGGAAVLGIRPEHLAICPSTFGGREVPGRSRISMAVSVVEPLGDRLHVHGTTPSGIPLTTQISAELTVRPADELKLTFDTKHIHFFANDAEGLRLA